MVGWLFSKTYGAVAGIYCGKHRIRLNRIISLFCCVTYCRNGSDAVGLIVVQIIFIGS